MSRTLVALSQLLLLIIPQRSIGVFIDITPTHEDKYYIYEWNSSITDSWPTTNKATGDYLPYFRQNFGTGPIINQTVGLHHTFQFGMLMKIVNY
jgi:hypothetical protein